LNVIYFGESIGLSAVTLVIHGMYQVRLESLLDWIQFKVCKILLMSTGPNIISHVVTEFNIIPHVVTEFNIKNAPVLKSTISASSGSSASNVFEKVLISSILSLIFSA